MLVLIQFRLRILSAEYTEDGKNICTFQERKNTSFVVSSTCDYTVYCSPIFSIFNASRLLPMVVLKEVMSFRKPFILVDSKNDNENACVKISLNTLVNVAETAVSGTNKCLEHKVTISSIATACRVQR